MGRRGDAMGEMRATWDKKFNDLFDPTITFRTLINEGFVFVILGLWCAERSAVKCCRWHTMEHVCINNPHGTSAR